MMNQKEALAVKDLAKDTVEALGLITERECLACLGSAIGIKKLKVKGDERHEWIDKGCPKCNGTGKVKWKWEPRVGEHYYFTFDLKHRHWIMGELTKLTAISYWNKGEAIPILHWETIERVLEKNGFILKSPHDWFGSHRPKEGENYGLWISTASREKDFKTAYEEGKSRQEAVMKAVIKLGEETK